MQRLTPLAALVFVLGCGRGTPVAVAPQQPAPTPAPVVKPPDAVPVEAAYTPVPQPEPSPQQRYDTAVWNALALAADNKLHEAVVSFEAARTAIDTEQVRAEIAKLKRRIEARAAAERVAADIRTVLTDGKPEEAAKLAADAMAAYSDSETSAVIVNLKRQADALVTARLDRDARLAQFRREAEDAERAKDLRAAALAYEQAVLAGGQEDLRRKLDATKAALGRYEDARHRAAELRRDADKLDDALAALREAAAVWDTPLVRQEIDDCILAIQSRRERLAIADFETRGDVGMADAGRTVAEELLPAFQRRFDVVERSQVGKVLDELRLTATDVAGGDAARAEFARLARVRYLVVGSVAPLSGVTVHARLIDVKTGLVVQTAKVVAPTPVAVLTRLPSLAALLLMSDEQRLAYERQSVAQLPPPPPAIAIESIRFPSSDELIPNNPPPIVVSAARPLESGGCGASDFAALPPPGAAVTVNVQLAKDHKVRLRGLAVAVELGDNLFRRGRYREANDQYQVALALSDGSADIGHRLELCRPHLPPVAAPVAVRPRVAVLDFVPLDGALVPSGLGGWAAAQLPPYLCPPYEAVDRGQVRYYAARLGVTLKDVVVDPAARGYLGRALNARFVVVGTLRGGPGSIVVAAHLLDAETGARLATAEVQAADPGELKYRLPELAHALLIDPADRDRLHREADAERAALAQARQAAGNNLTLALGIVGDLGKKRPGSVAVQVLFQELDRRAQVAALDAERRRDAERQAAAVAEYERRRADLAHAAETARIAAVRQAAAVAEAERQRQREVAYAQLVAQARDARNAQKYALAAQLFDSALGLQRRDDVFHEAAAVRVLAGEQARLKAAEAVAQRERQLRQQREAELARVRREVENERRRREAEEATRRRVREELDGREYRRLLVNAEQLSKGGNVDAAVVALQSARRLHPGDEADRLLANALATQARAAAAKKGEAARKEVETRLAAGKAAREKADAEARRNQSLYATALQAAGAAMRGKNYDSAIAQYQTAVKLYHSDAALSGLKQAQDARDSEHIRAEAESRRLAEEKLRQADIARLLAAGQSALAAGTPNKALDAFKLALKVAPGNLDALAGVSKAEQASLDALAAERKKQEARTADADAARAKAERERIAREAQAKADADRTAKAKADAVAKADRDRVDREAKAKAAADAKAKADRDRAQREAKEKADAAARAKADATAKQQRGNFDRLLKSGRDAYTAKRYAEAAQVLASALRLVPDDAEAKRLLAAAKGELDKAKAPPKPPPAKGLPPEYVKQMNAAAALARQEKYADAQKAYEAALRTQPNDPEATRRVEYAKRMDAGVKALKANKKPDATREFEAALKAVPKDAAATKALQQAKR